jgi:serine/threonine protein kinase
MRTCPHCHSTYVTEVEFCGIDGTRLEPADADPLIGEVVDRYRIEELLGTGSMAAVYRARHTVFDTDVAIKILLGELASNRTVVARFRREAQALSKVKHPNIVAVSDFGTTPNGLTFLVMDYVRGKALADVLDAEAPLIPARAARITRHIASALEEVHRLGLIHRDVKPANVVMVGQGDQELAKLLDFGIVAVEESQASTKLTATGRIVGTPVYMSPEQSQPGSITSSADLYSLGVVLYHMLAGRPPFQGDALAQVLVKHAVEPPPPLEPAGGLDRLALELLEKDPARRPPSAGSVIAELDRLGLDRAIGAAPTVPIPLAPFLRAPSNAAPVPPQNEAPARAISSSGAPLSLEESLSKTWVRQSSSPARLMAAALTTAAGESDVPLRSRPRANRPPLGAVPAGLGLAAIAIVAAVIYLWPRRDADELATAAPLLDVATATATAPSAPEPKPAAEVIEDAQEAAASLPRLERKVRRAMEQRGLSESDVKGAYETARMWKRFREAKDEGREAAAAVAAAELIDGVKSIPVNARLLKGKLKRVNGLLRSAKIPQGERTSVERRIKEISLEVRSNIAEDPAIKVAGKITRLEEDLSKKAR